jgi:hypothetical protein
MATDKKEFTVYLDTRTEAALEEYRLQHEHGSNSAALREILNQFFGLDAGQFVTRSEFEMTIADIHQRIDAVAASARPEPETEQQIGQGAIATARQALNSLPPKQ